MDDATNNELNLDKPLEDWVFRVRFTQQELKALQEMACAPHPAYLNNKEMMTEVEKILSLMEGVPKDNILLLDLPYQMLWALQGLVQNPAPVFFSERTFRRLRSPSSTHPGQFWIRLVRPASLPQKT